MKIENVYTSIACNGTPQSTDWGENNLVIFGASNAVALFDPNVRYDKMYHIPTLLLLIWLHVVVSIMDRLKF